MKKPPIKNINGYKINLKPFSKDLISNKYLDWMNNKATTKFIDKAKDDITLHDPNIFAESMINSE